MPKTPLLQLCQYLSLDADAAKSLLDMLRSLIVHCFPKMAENDIMSILRLRTELGDQLMDILEVLEHGELAAEDDQRDLGQVRASYNSTKEEATSFTNELVHRERALASKSKSKSKSPKSRSGRAFPSTLPALSDQAFWECVERERDLLPPDDSVVFLDRTNGRWQLFWPSTRLSRSNAILKHTFACAARRCVMQAWHEWIRRGGSSPPFALAD